MFDFRTFSPLATKKKPSLADMMSEKNPILYGNFLSNSANLLGFNYVNWKEKKYSEELLKIGGR